MIEELHICEMFYSLQGESSWAGMPCAFIRLAGCNLRCSYCDTPYSWERNKPLLNIKEIMAWTNKYPGAIVEITGGEPLLQDNIYPLIAALVKSGRKVLVETNGTITLEFIPFKVSIIMDIKCPDSYMDEHNRWENIDQLRKRQEKGSVDEIKFVLSSEEDFYWAMDKLNEYNLATICPVIFSPVVKTFNPRRLAELILNQNIPARLQLQLQRIIWPEIKRGV